MIQWPAAFCRTRSFISAFFEPNSFMASLLSVGWKMFWSWLRTQPGFPSPDANEIPRELIPDPVPAISSCFGAGADFDLLSQFARLVTLFWGRAVKWKCFGCLMAKVRNTKHTHESER